MCIVDDTATAMRAKAAHTIGAAAPSIDLVENYTQLVKSKATKEK